MKIEPPKIIEDFKKIAHSIAEIMENPYLDHASWCKMNERFRKCRTKIWELEEK
tara:strand:- start:541 stop:702 length:162 start_codon:yes stop_codon:yes gene_type:complete